MGDTRDIVERATEAFNSHDHEQIRANYADNVVFTAPGDVRLEGPDPVSEYAMSWLRAFPDAKLTVQDTVVEGNAAAVQMTFDGTHTDTLAGPEGDIPATNRHLTGRASEFVRVEGGKIVEEHLYFDQVEVMTQLGLMPEAATTA
jgi:steroid delta-isomerase-like uncharacterized protein